MKKILIHGSGHKADSWNKVIAYMENDKDILCPNLATILNGKETSYTNLYSSFAEFCNEIDGKIDLCGLSLGGILALNYAIDYPDKVEKLILIGTPHKVPKVMFSIQNVVFKLLPKSLFETMAFDKNNTFILGETMKKLDFSNRVHKVQCPTLVISGEKDSANIKSAYYLSENIKNAELKIIANTGHVVNEENPEELSKLLIEFWKNEERL